MSKDITETGIKFTEYSKINIFITKFQVSQTKFIPWSYSFSPSVDKSAAVSKKLKTSAVYEINFSAQQISVKVVQILMFFLPSNFIIRASQKTTDTRQNKTLKSITT